MSLNGKTILITRQREQSLELVAEIEKRGGRAVVLPMIRIVDPESWKECDAALGRLSAYQAIVFTSTNGVESFFRRLVQRGGDSSALAHLDVYAVGEKTGEELRRKGIALRYVPETFSAGSLVGYFQGNDVTGKRFLLVQGNLSSEELAGGLAELGAEVDAQEFYRNEPPDASTAEELHKLVTGGQCDVVTFASPSAARNFATAMKPEELIRLSPETRVAVIGPTTRAAAGNLGFRVDVVAWHSTGKGFVDAIEEYYLNN